ncbi:MAG TPA: hypothetical protein VNL18_14055 [Gemmatimonadales bacterium]|nr:hypothetical protein [Gemmatimonadales bacterium]
MPARTHALCLLTIGAVACSSSAGGASATAAPRRNSPVITAEEIAAASGSSAYDVVRQLRPAWLVTRGGNAEPVAYVDGTRYGSLEDLRNVAVDTIREIRWMDSRDATTRYGTGHQAGVIEVMTVRSPR